MWCIPDRRACLMWRLWRMRMSWQGWRSAVWDWKGRWFICQRQRTSFSFARPGKPFENLCFHTSYSWYVHSNHSSASHTSFWWIMTYLANNIYNSFVPHVSDRFQSTGGTDELMNIIAVWKSFIYWSTCFVDTSLSADVRHITGFLRRVKQWI